MIADEVVIEVEVYRMLDAAVEDFELLEVVGFDCAIADSAVVASDEPP